MKRTFRVLIALSLALALSGTGASTVSAGPRITPLNVNLKCC